MICSGGWVGYGFVGVRGEPRANEGATNGGGTKHTVKQHHMHLSMASCNGTIPKTGTLEAVT